MNKVIARWEARGGKTWLELYEEEVKGKPSYFYRGTDGGGNVGWRDSAQHAIDYLEQRGGAVYHTKQCMPTFKRVI